MSYGDISGAFSGVGDFLTNTVQGVGNFFGLGSGTPDVSGLGVGAASDPAMAAGVGGYAPVTSTTLPAAGSGALGAAAGTAGGFGAAGGYSAVLPASLGGGGYSIPGATSGASDIPLRGGAGLPGPISAPPSSASPMTATSAAGSTFTPDTSGANLSTAGAATPAPSTATPTPTPSAPAGGPTTSLGKFAADPSLSKFGDVIAANPGLAIGAGGLGLSLLKNNSSLPQLPKLEAQANQLGAQGAALTAPLTTGKLPAGAQAQVDQQLQSAIADIRSQYAGMGLSGSSMETEAINQARQNSAALTFQIAQNMATTGLGETKTSSQLLESIMNAQLSSDNELQSAIVGFAQAAAGGGPTIKIGGSA